MLPACIANSWQNFSASTVEKNSAVSDFSSAFNPFDPSRYYSDVWKQSPLLAVCDRTSASSQ
jgi:hypothetical protein